MTAPDEDDDGWTALEEEWPLPEYIQPALELGLEEKGRTQSA